MKIILSRKGFDSANGGCASPILPDGTLLSLPIPAGNDDESIGNGVKLSDLSHIGKTYLELIPGKYEDKFVHLDPDIRVDNRKLPTKWKAVFGQCGAAETHLENMNVEVGDLFLFFGWFRSEGMRKNGKLCYRGPNLHVIYGYLQIGKIINARHNNADEIKKYVWHPHSVPGYPDNNTLYVAVDHLSFAPELPGYGTFDYSKELVLTKDGYSRSRWELPDCFRKASISHHNADSFKKDYFQSANIGQEFVVLEDDAVNKWARTLIVNHSKKS